jgi:hypothetical protein
MPRRRPPPPLPEWPQPLDPADYPCPAHGRLEYDRLGHNLVLVVEGVEVWGQDEQGQPERQLITNRIPTDGYLCGGPPCLAPWLPGDAADPWPCRWWPLAPTAQHIDAWLGWAIQMAQLPHDTGGLHTGGNETAVPQHRMLVDAAHRLARLLEVPGVGGEPCEALDVAAALAELRRLRRLVLQPPTAAPEPSTPPEVEFRPGRLLWNTAAGLKEVNRLTPDQAALLEALVPTGGLGVEVPLEDVLEKVYRGRRAKLRLGGRRALRQMIDRLQKKLRGASLTVTPDWLAETVRLEAGAGHGLGHAPDTRACPGGV